MLKSNSYIMNLEGKFIVKAIEKEGQYSTRNRSWSKIYSSSMPYSLEMMQLDKIFPKELFIKDNKQYTNAIINVTFNNSEHEYTEHIDEETEEIKHQNTCRKRIPPCS